MAAIIKPEDGEVVVLIIGVVVLVATLFIVVTRSTKSVPDEQTGVAQVLAVSRAQPALIKVVGVVTYKRVYTFGIAQSGQSGTSCKVCGRPGQNVFAVVINEAGNEYRFCVWCFRVYGGDLEVQRASSRSKYIRRVASCINALEQLRTEFPNPDRRPYGEKSLLAEISLPFSGYEGIERVIDKILNRRWTTQDLERIAGREGEGTSP